MKFHMRKTKIMKILKSNERIMEIIKKNKVPFENYSNHENFIISYDKYSNHENTEVPQ